MRKIFMFCLTGALALATTSCKDEKVTTMQTITVNGQICEVKALSMWKKKPTSNGKPHTTSFYSESIFQHYRLQCPTTVSI